jgi:hypothetical protein
MPRLHFRVNRFELHLHTSKLLALILASVMTFWVCGCASIPAEAPVLSSELGNRLQKLEHAHLALLHHYMEERRARVNEFVDHEWIPTFTHEFFSDPEMQAAWNQVVQSGSEEDRSGYLLSVAPPLMEEISAKRNEMLLPIYQIERELEQNLREDYTQAKAINTTLTSFLSSASELERTRQDYLARAGVDEGELRGFVAEMDDTVNGLVVKKGQAIDAYRSTEDYLAKMKAILERLQNRESTEH